MNSQLKDYKDRRNMLNSHAIHYLINKYRETMMDQENKYRQAIQLLTCEHCQSFNGCEYCKHI